MPIASWIRRARNILRSRRFHAEMDEELQFHQDMAQQHFADQGLPPDQARLAATRRLSSPLRVREESREAWGAGAIDRLLQDIRYSIRLMVRRPGFTAIAVAVLALGLGASTSVFSVVHSVLMRPLPFERPGELVFMLEGLPRVDGMRRPGAVSPPDYLAFHEQQRSFAQLAMYKNRSYELSGEGEPERLTGVRLSPSLFTLLGRQPLLGRTFTEEEDRSTAKVVILSWKVWQRRFLGSPQVLGRIVHLDRHPYTIVGIMPPAFEFPLRGAMFNDTPAELFLPLSLTDDQRTNYGSNFSFSVMGRLKPGVTIDAARAEASVLKKTLEARYPADLTRTNDVQIEIVLRPVHSELVGVVAPMLWLLFGAVTLVLLVGCADLGGLLLTRAATRAGELNVRAALGAGRGRLIRQLMTESLVIAAAGALLGLGLAYAATCVIATQAGTYLPRAQEIGLDATVVAAMVAFAVLSGVAFGLAPALWITNAHGSVGSSLASRRTTSGRGERHLLRTLVVVQVTLAIVLAVGAGLLVRSLDRLMAVDPGFRSSTQAVAGFVTLPSSTYRDRAVVRSTVDRLLTSARALPGARAAGLASTLPMHLDEVRAFALESPFAGAGRPATALTWVAGSYFSALEIPLRRGRFFSDQDGVSGPLVVIVNDTFARRVFGARDPIGQRICWGIACGEPGRSPMTIVGIVGDVKQGALSSQTRPEVYEPLLQQSDVPPDSGDNWTGPRIFATIVRAGNAEVDGTKGADMSEALIRGLRQAVHDIDPSLPLSEAQTLDTLVRSSATTQRFSTRLLGTFALAAVLLAALGLYGLLSSVVTQRTREIGVRVALGASPGDVVSLIVRQGLTLVGSGLAIGLACALAATQTMKGLLFGVQPFDPMTFGAVAVTLAAVGMLASLLPAWRAARVDPVRALRGE